jgi:hypothetical protein
MLFCHRTCVEYGEKDSRTNAANGFELTCGAVSMRARFAHDIELLLIINRTTIPLTASTTERVHAAPAG